MRQLPARGMILGAIIALGAVPSECRADWIQLRSGVQIHGKILRQDKDEITLQLERGGVSSFDMRTVQSVHRTEPETRKKLPLDEEERAGNPLPDGIHPRPDAIRSSRRPVPGGTLLLPEDAVRESTPAITPPAGGTTQTDAAPLRPEAVYLLGKQECRVRVGREGATGSEAEQTEALRERIRTRPGVTLHALDVHRVAGLTTWIAEWSTAATPAPQRTVSGWIRVGEDALVVVEVELPEAEFLANPYRYRVIPLSFRPEDGPPGSSETAGSPRPGTP